MNETEKSSTPRYLQVAVDLASKIALGEYKVGDKIHGRSLVAAQYAVSPETARRAIGILASMNIVDTLKGSGVVIISYENAVQFVNRQTKAQTLKELKEKIISRTSTQIKEVLALQDEIESLIDRANNFSGVNPFIPFEITIEEGSKLNGRNLAHVNLWQNTGATAVALKRDETVLLSPGPETTFQVGDRLYFIGEEACYVKVRQFLSPESFSN